MTIEERIVKLGLENNNFEKHAQESLKTLDRIDQSLKSFGNAVGFDKIGSMIDTVTHRFSALGVAGDQVIRNITNSVSKLIGQMGDLAKSMSFDQINAGFDKYGEKTQAVQTIMAATAKDWNDQGAQMEWVNEQLEKLNWFTDETSYSFLDMVNNIGKFTSNGIGLEDSVTAMEGISTWAAISGANVQEASRAMYNLSQALATGSVKLIDWKSIENANMATREFKETALETAVSLGTLTKSANGMYKTMAGHEFTTEQFNTQLSDGWFSKDVLMKTLKSYGSFTDVLNKASKASKMTATDVLKQIELYKEGKTVVSDLLPYMKELTSAENDLGYRAFKAAQEAKTFKDAIDATKDAVSTGWMNLFEKMFGDYLTAKGFWTEVANSLYDIFAEPVNKLNEIFDIAFGGGKKGPEEAATKLSVLNEYLAGIGKNSNDLIDAFHKVDEIKFINLIDQYGTLEKAIEAGAVSAEDLKKVLAELGADSSTAEKIASDMTENANAVEAFEERLKKAGRTMKDFGEAFAVVDSASLGALIDEYGSLEEAIKNGAIEAELFKKILQEMANPSTKPEGPHVQKSTYVDKNGKKVGNVAETNPTPYSAAEIAEMNALLEESDEILAKIQKQASETITLEDGSEAFREGLLNLLGLFGDLGFAVDEAFNAVFGGSEDADTAIENLAIKLNKLVIRFRDFTAALRNEEAIEKFKKGLIAVFRVAQAVGNVIGKITSQVFALAKGALRIAISVIQKVTATITELIERLKKTGAFTNLVNGIKAIFDGIKAPLKQVKENITSIFKAFGYANGLKNFSFIKTVGDWLTKVALNFNIAAQNFKKFMSSAETAAKIDKIFLGIFHFAKSAKDAITNLAEIVGPVLSSIGTAISNLITKIKNFKSSLKGAEDGETLFSKILNAMSKAIDWISGGFAKIKAAVQDAFGGDNGVGLTNILKNVLKAFLGFTAIKGLGKILGGIAKAFGGIGSIGEFLQNPASIFGNLLDGLKEMFGFASKEKSFSQELRNIAISIGILALSLKLLASIPEDKIASAMGHLTTVLVEMLGAIKALDFIGPEAKTISKVALAMVGIAVAMLLLAGSMWIISKIDPKRLAASWAVMAATLAAIVGVLYLISTFSENLNSKKLLAAGLAIFGIAAAMLVLSLALGLLSLIDPKKLAKAWVAMAASLLTVIGALYLLSKIDIGPGKLLAAGLALIGVAAAMVVIALALMLFKYIDFNDILTMAVALGALTLALGLLGKYANPLGMMAAGLAMVFVAGAMLIMAAAIWAINKVIENNSDAMLYFAIVLGVVTIALIALGSLGPVILAAGAALLLAGIGFLAGAAAMWVLAQALKALVGLDLPAMAKGLALLGLALIPLGIGGVFLGVGAIGLALGGAALLLLGAGLRTMDGLDLKGLAGGLALLGLALIPLGIGGVFLGVGAIGLAIGAPALKALAEALGPLADGLKAFETVNWESIGKGFVALAGAITALFALEFATVLNGVPVLRELAEAMPAVSSGFSSFDGLNADAIATAGAGLGTAINALFKAQFATFRDSVPILAEMAEIMPSVASGFSSFDGMNADAIALAGAGLGTAINALFKAQFATFRDSVPILAEMAEIMPAVSSGFSSFDGLNADAISTAGDGLGTAITALFKAQFATFSDSVPVLAEMAAVMPSVANGFSAFEDLNSDAIAMAGAGLGTAITALFAAQFATFSDSVPILAEMAEVMPGVAEGFKAFEDLNSDAVALAGAGLGTAITALFTAQFATFRDSVPVLAEMAEVIPSLSNGFKSFEELDGDLIEKAGAGLSTAIGALFKLEVVTLLKDGTDQLKTFADALPVIATGFAAFKELEPSWLGSISKAVSGALDDLSGGGFFSKKQDYSGLIDLGNALSQFWAGLSNFTNTEVTSPVTMISQLLSQMNAEITNSLPSFEADSSGIPTAIANGITLNGGALVTAMTAILAELSTAFVGYDAVWQTIGGNISIGVANGIYQESYNVVNAVGELARIIQETIQAALEIHSPSRVMARIGGFIDQGLSKGILDESGMIEDSMIVAISPALAALSALADEDFSISPTITPVVDMSNIDAATSSMNGMFIGNVGVSANMSNAISKRMDDVERLAANMDKAGQTINNGDNITFNIYGAEGQDPNEIADAVMSRMQNLAVRRTAAYS